MTKKAAVLAVDPVNGAGLFQYLETFFENDIPFTLFAVAGSREIRTNSGVRLTADATIAELKGREGEFGALVFACGDAVPVFAQHAGEPWNAALLGEMKTFAEQGKLLIGHCGAGLLFDSLCKEITNLTDFQADVISLSRYFGRLAFRHAAKRCVS